MIIILIVLWWSIGLAGFIFWWTKDFDLTASDLSIGFIAGFLGILAWLIGAMLHGNLKDKTIIKHRNR